MYQEDLLINTVTTPQPFKLQPHKMVRHTQTIRREQPTNCLSVFDHFVGLERKWLTPALKTLYYSIILLCILIVNLRCIQFFHLVFS